ncbi:hemolysin III family protein [Meiothermus sp.]|uniref:PAQR family membrane homeostasis protein TrhA n=1 Tax=Meiothermus sp. TaxID=1955249 RepID=UPI00307D19E9
MAQVDPTTHRLIRSREERLNTLTHGLGVVASVAACAVLITFTALHGNVWQVVGACVFSAALILMYLASTVYHGALSPKAKARLEILDHCAIYVLIAGTYTPFTLVTIHGPWGWSLFGVVWGLAVLGIGFKIFFTGRFELISTLLYLAMGWLIVVAIQPLMQAMSGWGLFWLVAGGLAYTMGTYFFLNKRLPYAHFIWHLFVLMGSSFHFVAVWSQVVPG